MEILHLNGHIACRACPNCEKETRPSIETKEISTGSHCEQQAVQSKIIFLLKGEIACSFGMYNDCRMRRGQALYLPAGYNFSYRAESEALLLFIRPYFKMQFCDCYQLEDLAQASSDTQTDSPYMLEMKGPLMDYADMLAYFIRQGICCRYYSELKINELLYLMGELYGKEELAAFFREALSGDPGFSHYVMNNYHKYHSISEMAVAMDMSLSNLEKRFRKAFNISGYKWMNGHRAKKIYHALRAGEKSLNELRVEFGFASKSSFNRYCKQHLGQSPGEIRQRGKQGCEQAGV